MPGELVQLGERPRVQQQLDPLAGRLLALGVLLLHRGGRPGMHRLVDPAIQVGKLARGRMDILSLALREPGPASLTPAVSRGSPRGVSFASLTLAVSVAAVGRSICVDSSHCIEDV